MKLYKKLLGVLTLLMSSATLVWLIFTLIDGSDSDRVLALLAFIPVYIVIHFAIVTRLGFENGEEKHSRMTLVGTIAILVVMLIFPFRYGIDYYQNRNFEKTLGILKNRGVDENRTTGIQGALRTKFESKEMLYQLELRGLKQSYTDLNAVTIQLEDKDRFVIENIKIFFNGDANISLFETNDSLLFTVKGSIYFSSEDYRKIDHWELLSHKN